MIAVERAPCHARGELETLIHELEDWTGPREVLEVLVEGPRGSAKSRTALTHIMWNTMCDVPNSKWLVVRKTRESLTKSFCQTFEQEVVPEDMRADVVGDLRPSNRTEYLHPNGSWIGLVGLDKPSKHQGTNVDGVVLEEASELTWKQVEPFFGAIRQFTPGMKWQMLLALTNPDAPSHWLNKRAISGQMRRVVTHLHDNPKWYLPDRKTKTPEGRSFLQSLQRYTGVARDRHVLGLWRGAEGMVWENFDEHIHVIDPPKDPIQSMGIVEFRGSMDWGSTHPGALQVWGVDAKKRMTRWALVYHTGKTPDWWSNWVVQLAQEFSMRRIVCDPSRPEMITQLNDRLAKAGCLRICYGANNKKASSGDGDMGGLALVKWGLERDETGVPRIRFLKNALRHPPDPALVAENRPTTDVEEIPSYVHDRDAAGEYIFERTDKTCQDDGCDATRYEASDNWSKDPEKQEREVQPWPIDSDAALHGTVESLAAERAKRERGDTDDEPQGIEGYN